MKKTRSVKCHKRQERRGFQEGGNDQLCVIPIGDKERAIWSGEMRVTGSLD